MEVDSNAAFAILDKLVAEGKMPVKKSMEGERSLLSTAKTLNQDMAQQKLELDELNERCQTSSELVAKLRTERDKATEASSLAHQSETEAGLQALKLDHDMKSKKEELAAAQKRRQEEVQPKLDALNKEAEIRESSTVRISLRDEIDELSRKEESRSATAEKNALISRQARMKDEPEKMAKQIEYIAKGRDAMSVELSKATELCTGADAELKKEAGRALAVEEAITRQQLELDTLYAQIEQQQKHEDMISKEYDMSKEIAHSHATARVKLEMDLKMVSIDVKRESDVVAKRTSEKDQCLKAAKAAELELAAAKADVPVLEHSIATLTRENETLKGQAEKQQNAIESLKGRVGDLKSQFIKSSGMEKVHAARITELDLQNNALEDEVQKMRILCHGLDSTLGTMLREASTRARDSARSKAKSKDAQNRLKIQEMAIVERMRAEQEITDIERLYESIKKEKNRCLNLVQSAQHASSEASEKLNILMSELEVVRDMSMEKEKALIKARRDLANCYLGRDAARSELSQLIGQSRKFEAKIDENIATIDRCNNQLESKRQAIGAIAADYKLAVQGRNAAGIVLLERQEELVNLQNKLKAQDALMAKTELDYRSLMDKQAELGRKISETKRQHEIAKRLLPEVPQLEREVLKLQNELVDARAMARRLTIELEDPTRRKQWKELEGVEVVPEKLKEKLDDLTTRVSMYDEQSSEKAAILTKLEEQVTLIVARIENENEDDMTIMRKLSDTRAKLRAVTNKMMACVAELSVSQMECNMFDGKIRELRPMISDAHDRMSRGEPPTDESESEWMRMERDRQVRVEQLRRRKELDAGGDDDAPSATVETRPNAYLSNDDLGLPVPYGGYAPFKPAVPSALMSKIYRPKQETM